MLLMTGWDAVSARTTWRIVGKPPVQPSDAEMVWGAWAVECNQNLLQQQSQNEKCQAHANLLTHAPISPDKNLAPLWQDAFEDRSLQPRRNLVIRDLCKTATGLVRSLDGGRRLHMIATQRPFTTRYISLSSWGKSKTSSLV